jgi:hypothetical protein
MILIIVYVCNFTRAVRGTRKLAKECHSSKSAPPLKQAYTKLARNASNIALFWIDAICIPPDSNDPEQQNAPYLALEAIRPYLPGCYCCIFRDMMRKAQCEPSVVFGNTRLQTPQEGALAKSLYFRFQDAAHEPTTNKGLYP